MAFQSYLVCKNCQNHVLFSIIVVSQCPYHILRVSCTCIYASESRLVGSNPHAQAISISSFLIVATSNFSNLYLFLFYLWEHGHLDNLFCKELVWNQSWYFVIWRVLQEEVSCIWVVIMILLLDFGHIRIKVLQAIIAGRYIVLWKAKMQNSTSNFSMNIKPCHVSWLGYMIFGGRFLLRLLPLDYVVITMLSFILSKIQYFMTIPRALRWIIIFLVGRWRSRFFLTWHVFFINQLVNFLTKPLGRVGVSLFLMSWVCMT